VLIDLFLLSMFAGFYSVPLYALIRAPRADASRADHCRQQHPQCAVHDQLGVAGLLLLSAGLRFRSCS
jgi:hypothetical protein